MLETVEQPTKYMLDSLRSKDGEIESLRSAQHRLVAKTAALERACRWAAGVSPFFVAFHGSPSRLVVVFGSHVAVPCRAGSSRTRSVSQARARAGGLLPFFVWARFCVGVVLVVGVAAAPDEPFKKQHHVCLHLGHLRDPPPPISLASLTKPVPGRPRKRRPTWRESWKSPPGWPKGGDGRGGNGTEKTEAAAAAAPGMGCPGAPTLQSPRRGGRRRG